MTSLSMMVLTPAPSTPPHPLQLVAQHKVVLFMKGTPAAPMCGFSAATSKTLAAAGAEVHGVDVLANPALRVALKEFSQWPTFPQVYIGGVFVGGWCVVAWGLRGWAGCGACLHHATYISPFSPQRHCDRHGQGRLAAKVVELKIEVLSPLFSPIGARHQHD